MNYIITGTTYNGKYIAAPEAGTRVLSNEELVQSKLRFQELALLENSICLDIFFHLAMLTYA